MARDSNQTLRRFAARQRHNVEFVQGLLRRHPEIDVRDLRSMAIQETPDRRKAETFRALESVAPIEPEILEKSLQLETIVSRERPVMFVEDDWLNLDEVTRIGEEADRLITMANDQKAVLRPLMPLVGRIDVSHFPNMDFVGTGWLVAPDVVVTNRHVANLIARWDGRKFVFRRGVGGDVMTSTLDTLHEFDDVAFDEDRRFAVSEVLYIEPESGPYDIAFLRISRRADGRAPSHIQVAPADLAVDSPVLVVGYPARAPKRVIPDQAEMEELFRGRYDVKRAAPGYTMLAQRGSSRHDCTTLGGNSGSVVLDLKTGRAAGLHFAGLYQEANYAVPASVLNDYISRRVWDRPPEVETAKAPPPAAGFGSAVPGTTTIVMPLSITLGLGTPQVSLGTEPGLSQPPSTADAEDIAAQFWDQRPGDVVAVRLGYPAEGDRFGSTPFIAASVAPDRLTRAAAEAPRTFQGLAVRYVVANAAEQVEALGIEEAAATIAYDDDARMGTDFAFDLVDEEMQVQAHVGPEYSWDVLKAFLESAEGELVSGMYEFHATHIADAIEARLNAGVKLQMVLDNATFGEAKEGDFDRKARFRDWRDRLGVQEIVAPEGAQGLISNAYHIKVTVRSDDRFWLSSGNWKAGSSQPIVTDAQRDRADFTDIEGNREWHVVVGNRTLAKRLRNHLRQDFRRSEELGGGPTPREREASDFLLEVPIIEDLVLERPAPGRVLKPKTFTGRRRARPLLTPDRQGEVYSSAVLELIQSARSSLLFQIPYIAMPSNPRQDRGYIDELLKALVHKLKTLDDARVLLRSGGSRYSDPQHAAWYFKSKGVDIANRLRVIDNHHTKGMVVDDRQLLIGSHNWSAPGVTLNRDASLLFDDDEIARYFAEAFEIDWARSRRITPAQFRAREEAPGSMAGPAVAIPLRKVRLSDLLKEDD